MAGKVAPNARMVLIRMHQGAQLNSDGTKWFLTWRGVVQIVPIANATARVLTEKGYVQEARTENGTRVYEMTRKGKHVIGE